MLNPALKFLILAVSSMMAASCAATSQHTEPFQTVSAEEPAVLRDTILVSSSAGPNLEIHTDAAGGGTATLSHGGRVWRVTEASCEAFLEALQKWRNFPSIRPGPAELRNDPPLTQIPPGLLDGYGGWTIRTEAAVPENQPVVITIYDPGGLYGIWAEETVRGIMRCPEGF